MTSWCTCTAGTAGEVCNQVNFEYKKAYISPACTIVPQKWTKSTKKDVQPNKIKNMSFAKTRRPKRIVPETKGQILL